MTNKKRPKEKAQETAIQAETHMFTKIEIP